MGEGLGVPGVRLGVDVAEGEAEAADEGLEVAPAAALGVADGAGVAACESAPLADGVNAAPPPPQPAKIRLRTYAGAAKRRTTKNGLATLH
jgi:hypothetical protein